jgi:hypothetical protein
VYQAARLPPLGALEGAAGAELAAVDAAEVVGAGADAVVAVEEQAVRAAVSAAPSTARVVCRGMPVTVPGRARCAWGL